MRASRIAFISIVPLILTFLGGNFTTPSAEPRWQENHLSSGILPIPLTREIANDNLVFLPLIYASSKPIQRVNAPQFSSDIEVSETAVFWFGQVTPTDNYADVRVGYNNTELYIQLSVFDRLLWYDKTPSAVDLTTWDAVSLYLNLDGDAGDAPDTNAYMFVGQLNWWEERGPWQAGYRGDGSGWVADPVTFTTSSTWRGNAPNDNVDDRGWIMIFHIPFSSLGLSGPPPQGDIWGVGLTLHDRDDSAGTPISDKTWPTTLNADRPATWGQLRFGLTSYTPPVAVPGGVVTIRSNLNGSQVVDAHVGGHTTCGQDFGPNFFDGWGDANYAGYEQFNIQNQWDISDWPCFSKYYITLPLESIPPGKAIISATLRLYQFSNAGQHANPGPQPSLIQVSTIWEDWDESTLTWNNAPFAQENTSQAWVDPIPEFPGWPGLPREWDVSNTVAEAYASREPLRLVIYSADSDYHSGKYFISSDTGDWNEVGRPTLFVSWGDIQR